MAAAATGLVQFVDTSGSARRRTAVPAGLNNETLILNVGSLTQAIRVCLVCECSNYLVLAHSP